MSTAFMNTVAATPFLVGAGAGAGNARPPVDVDLDRIEASAADQPDAPAQTSYGPIRRWLLLSLLYTPLLASTVISKVSVPPFSGMGLGIGIPLTLMVTFVGMVCGAFVVDLRRFCLYVALVSSACLSQAMASGTFSITSIAFLIALFAPCVFGLRESAAAESRVTTNDVLRAFASYATVFALLGIVQYAIQFPLGPRVAFPIEFFLPRGFLVETYNYLNILYYGSSIYKANGLVFLEPSFFSQFTALGLLLELALWNRRSRLAIYLVALAVTYSGTGIMVLGAGLVTLVFVQRRWGVAMAALVVVAVVVLFAEPLGLQSFVDRATEFQSTGSSGFERFVAWLYVYKQYWWTGDLGTVLVGMGAGSFAGYSNSALYHAAEMSFSKVFFEFGIIGGLLYFAFLFQMVFASKLPLVFKVGMAVSLFLNQAYSMQVVGILLSVFAWPVPGGPVTRLRKSRRKPKARPDLESGFDQRIEPVFDPTVSHRPL
jgi:hypothetical protein